MKKTHFAHLSVALLALSCSSAEEVGSTQASTAAADSGGHTQSSAATKVQSKLEMPALEPGFQRFVAAAVPVPAGTTDDWLQWVAGPTDQDYDVVQLKGAQSKGGHHALLLSTMEAQDMGFTRKYTERDQLSTSSLGGVGAEGNVAIPEGVVFRLRKGSYLTIQAHYLNATDQDIEGETYIDVKMVPRDAAHTIAGHFASTTLKIALPPKSETNLDVECDVLEDLKILRMTNHMHYAGVSTFTEVTDPSGQVKMLKQDAVWSEDWALTPNYDNFPVAQPLLIPAGSKLRTHCTWNNTTDKPLAFPEEMCVFATITLGEKDATCIDGKFTARAPESASATAQPTAAGAALPPGAAGSAAPAQPAAAPTASAGACTSDADKAIIEAADYQDKQRTCGSMCLGAADSCASDCFSKNTTLSAGCASCAGAQITCAMMHCIGDCAGGFSSASCMPCLETNCGAAYHACSGL